MKTAGSSVKKIIKVCTARVACIDSCWRTAELTTGHSFQDPTRPVVYHEIVDPTRIHNVLMT